MIVSGVNPASEYKIDAKCNSRFITLDNDRKNKAKQNNELHDMNSFYGSFQFNQSDGHYFFIVCLGR